MKSIQLVYTPNHLRPLLHPVRPVPSHYDLACLPQAGLSGPGHTSWLVAATKHSLISLLTFF